MGLMTVSQVSKVFGVSTRMLRYYEQMGLLTSLKMEGYSYRVYDENSVLRLRQIIILRKLRVSLKQIGRIFADPKAENVLEIFMQNISDIDDEVTALSTMRSIFAGFIDRLRTQSEISLKSILLNDQTLLHAIDSLSPAKMNLKEKKSMDEVNKASEALSKLKKVRIVQLPPFTVLSHHYIGENPEETVGGPVSKFLREINLYEIKPDARMFGFNHPNPSKDREFHGYEDWVTIPDDLEVPAPFVKKRFKGGLYAVHNIVFGDFHEWRDLHYWAENNDKYEPDYSTEGEENMHGCLEEHVNWVYCNHLGWPENGIDGGLDLYLPVRLKK